MSTSWDDEDEGAKPAERQRSLGERSAGGTEGSSEPVCGNGNGGATAAADAVGAPSAGEVLTGVQGVICHMPLLTVDWQSGVAMAGGQA